MRRVIIGCIGLGLLLSVTACSSSNSTKKDNSTKTINKGVADSTLTIAFYYQDSIATQFDFYREIDSIVKGKQLSFQKELEGKMRAFQNYQAEIQKRYDNNEITGYEIEGIQRAMAQKQQSIAAFRDQKGGALQKKVMQYTIALSNKIDAAAKEFSKEKGIDLLLYYQQGGQITFINSAYDVTENFIDYLNQREGELRSGFEQEVESVKVDSAQLSTSGVGENILKNN